MNFLWRLARRILLSRPLRAMFAALMEDYREANLSCVAVAVNATVVNQTPGDYLEFGVHTGRSFLRAYECYERTRRVVRGWRDFQNVDPSRRAPPMRFFAFDAFDRGFPEPTGPDASDLKPLHWTAGGMLTAERDFRAACDRAGLDWSRVHVLAGYFADTATEATKERYTIQSAAVLHFDCDLYASTCEALAFATSLVKVGSILIFDDFFRFRGSERHGQYRAFHEWREANPGFGFRELARYRANSVAFICSRAAAEAGPEPT